MMLTSGVVMVYYARPETALGRSNIGERRGSGPSFRPTILVTNTLSRRKLDQPPTFSLEHGRNGVARLAFARLVDGRDAVFPFLALLLSGEGNLALDGHACVGPGTLGA